MQERTNHLMRYALLPGIWPRVKAFAQSGFSLIASLMAVIYYNIGLIPAGHSYLKQENYGRFGLRHVVAEAGNNLVFSRQNADKVILYFVVLSGLVLLFLQLLLLLFSLIAAPAMALSWATIMELNGHAPTHDMAFYVLDSVFGIMTQTGEPAGTGVGFFGSCASDTTVDCLDIRGNVASSPAVFPTPMHISLHAILHFYSMGISIVGLIIILYSVIAIVGETAASGTPFGQRFSRAWFVPRLIVFFALLAPISTAAPSDGVNNAGINMGQYITFHVARYGSNFATNAWPRVLGDGETQVSTTLLNDRSLIAKPNLPEVAGLVQFIHTVRTCMFAYQIQHGKEVHPYLVRQHSDDSTAVSIHTGGTEPRNAMGGTTEDALILEEGNTVVPFERALRFSRYESVVIRFGHHNPPDIAVDVLSATNPLGVYRHELGYVEPTCGEVHLSIQSMDPYVVGGNVNGLTVSGIQQNYYNLVYWMLSNSYMERMAYCGIQSILPVHHQNECVDRAAPLEGMVQGGPAAADTELPTLASGRDFLDYLASENISEIGGEVWRNGTRTYDQNDDIAFQMNAARDNVNYINNVLMPTEATEPYGVRARGWAGAALWYNRVAEINGTFSSAVGNPPRPFVYPLVMEEVADQHREVDQNVSYADRFNPRLANGEMAVLPNAGDLPVAIALHNAFSFWNTSAVDQTVSNKVTNNAFIDVINAILGTGGLFDILENKGVHPLAMLSSFGKILVDQALTNLLGGLATLTAGKTLSAILSDVFGKAADTASKFMFKFGMMLLSVGFVLYYVLPLMPFIYFFFSFSGWIKSIFEAVVAMPLWALAHIKIDGNGLPGPWATNGYFLLFEIFLRPIMTIFGFIASIVFFAALVDVLNDVFYTLSLVVGGADIQAALFPDEHDGIFENAAGHVVVNRFASFRGTIDIFFYTVLYTIIVYMIGLSSFKMIDGVPNAILRWVGVTVSTFHETAGDPAKDLVSKTYRSTQMTNAQIRQLIDKNSTALSDTYMQTRG